MQAQLIVTAFTRGDQHSLGDFTSALQSAKRALQVRIKVFERSTADSYHSLGVTHYLLGDFNKLLANGHCKCE